MSFEAEAYAFSSSVYGGRPTFALTRRVDPESELTLYEYAPTEIAEARATRFERVGRHKQVVIRSLEDTLVNGDTPETACHGESPPGPTARNWSWDDWCGIKIATLRGKQLNAAGKLIRTALADAGRDSDAVLSGEPVTISLPEGVGIRLSLAFLGMKPLQRYDRLNEFANGLTTLSLEECYYWHAKARSPTSPSGTKALRVLLTGHIG